ncbi:MAG: hypothetical protein ACSHWW_13215 [Nonlabens sp.]|uniref:hypothetical protein n=1 Tax=Nonlabens sp. TaxID=1888209 RepID=UPI003EFA2540
MKKILNLILLLLIANLSQAQHCNWDYEEITVIKLISNSDDKSLIDVNITVVDSLNQPIVNSGEPLMFWQNLRNKKDSLTGINLYYEGGINRPYYWFANDNFVYVSHREDKKPVRIKITQRKANSEKRHIENTIIEIPTWYTQPLCTNSSNWLSDESPAFIKGYKPYIIRIKDSPKNKLQTNKTSYSESDTIVLKNITNQMMELKTTGGMNPYPNVMIQKYQNNGWINHYKNEQMLQAGLSFMYLFENTKININLKSLYQGLNSLDDGKFRIVLTTTDYKHIYSNPFLIESN